MEAGNGFKEVINNLTFKGLTEKYNVVDTGKEYSRQRMCVRRIEKLPKFGPQQWAEKRGWI